VLHLLLTHFIYFGETNNQETDKRNFIKCTAEKIYEFALTNVPKAMKSCLDEKWCQYKGFKKNTYSSN
jgi:3-oxoacyl-[acyl-carrier-protein] synthase-3